ncbi:hypothetical protein FDECE_2506 [Fusarium decemcellulare]|nr:hypothetical protein FDECE_2506 [Fusarium decemcellulare]
MPQLRRSDRTRNKPQPQLQPDPDPQPKPKQKSTSRSKRNTPKKNRGKPGQWWEIRAILDERISENGEPEYLVDWVGTTKAGKPYEKQWAGFPIIDASEAALADWNDQKRLKKDEERQCLGAHALPTDPVVPSDAESDEPRPANWKRLKRINASTLTRPRSESFDQDHRPTKKIRAESRAETESALSEEPVPSFVSASSVDIDAGSPEFITSYDFAQLRGQSVAIVLHKPDNFDASEYQSISNTQSSSQKLSELENDDQRAAFASQLSQDTIPDSQDLSGHIWAGTDLEVPSVSEESEEKLALDSPQATGQLVPEDPSELIDQREDATGQREAQNSSNNRQSPDLGSLPFPNDQHPVNPNGDLGDEELPDADSDLDDYNLEKDPDTEVHRLGESQDAEDSQAARTHDIPQDGNNSQGDQLIEQVQEVADSSIEEDIQDLREDPITEVGPTHDYQALTHSPSEKQNTQGVPETEEDHCPLDSQDSPDIDGAEVNQTTLIVSCPADSQNASGNLYPPGQYTVASFQCSEENHTFTPINSSNATQPVRLSLLPSGSGSAEQPRSSNHIPVSSLVVPDSQDRSLTSEGSHPRAIQNRASLPPAQITPLASQVEIIPDSVATGSDIPSRQPNQSQRDTLASQGLSSSGVSAQLDLRSLAEAATATLQQSSGVLEASDSPAFFTQPKTLRHQPSLPSSLSTQAERISSEAEQSVSSGGPQLNPASGSQVHIESNPRDSQAAQVTSEPFEVVLDRILSGQGAEPSNRVERVQSENPTRNSYSSGKPNKPRSQDSTSFETCPIQSQDQRLSQTSAVSAMDESSAPRQPSSAVDELKNLIDFSNASLLTQVEEPAGDEQPPASSEAPKDLETMAIRPGQIATVPDVLVSSSESQIHSQPLYSVEPWKAEVLGNTSGAPTPSISPASIMADPNQSAVDSMQKIVNSSFRDSARSITRSLIPEDSEQMIPPGTISPAAISGSVDPVESTRTLTFSNQATMPLRIDDSSGQSITMGQVPDEREYDISSQSSHQDEIASQHIVTLPMQASRRPYYEAVIVDYKNDIQDFGNRFTRQIYEEPSEALVGKIDSLFNRLLNICDYPQDVIGTSLEELPAADLAKYCCDANAKLSFLFELMSILGEKETGILIVARTPELLRLIFTLTEAAGIECSAESIGKQSDYPSVTRITLALASEEFDPYKFDVVIGYDHAFNSSGIARQLSTSNVRKPPLVLLLVTTHTIEHIAIRIPQDLSVLERKNALLASIILARRYLEDPERGYGDPHQVAEVFAAYLNGNTDAVSWEPQGIPDEVLDVYENPQSQSQSLVEDEFSQGNGLKRKFDNDDDDDDAKRMRVLPVKDLPVDSNGPPLTLAVREFLEAATPRGEEKKESDSRVLIPLSLLESLREKADEYMRQIVLARETEVEYKNTINRLEKEHKEHQRTVGQMERSNRTALQDRTMFEKEKRKIETAAKVAEEVAQREKERQLKRIEELESTIAQLTDNPDVSKMKDMLEGTEEKVRNLEKKLENKHQEVDFMRNRYQEVNDHATRLAAENKGLKAQQEDLQFRASENLRTIHQVNSQNERQALIQQNADLTTQLKERELQVNVLSEEIRTLRNGRPQTRGTSVPRSPRVPMMSPRPGRAGFTGSASRGTSPAPMPVHEGGMGPGVQFMGQQPGNGRWGHLRD